MAARSGACDARGAKSGTGIARKPSQALTANPRRVFRSRSGSSPYAVPVLLAAALVLASVTDKLADFATRVVGDLGLPGVFLLMVPESACIPIPSEATMLFAGFNVSEGKFSLVAAVAVGVAGNLVGSSLAYAVGYYGRLEL